MSNHEHPIEVRDSDGPETHVDVQRRKPVGRILGALSISAEDRVAAGVMTGREAEAAQVAAQYGVGQNHNHLDPNQQARVDVLQNAQNNIQNVH